ncbi:MAG TPA: type II secretion system protein [Verrucomicrobiae bacterium]
MNRIAGRMGETAAFTLIELLVVIAIIGILAALVIPLSGIATTKMRIARVRTELNVYVNAIENYKLETGEYPQDNALMRDSVTNSAALLNEYRKNAALNPLFYELTGTVFTNSPGTGFVKLHDGEFVPATEITKAFGRSGLRNSARNKHDIDYKGFTVKEAQIAELNPTHVQGALEIEILSVPVPTPRQTAAIPGYPYDATPLGFEGPTGKKINPWFYDASSTNRHNKNTFDLWAEIEVGGKPQVIANWKN